jgi:DNA-binding LytR/AlgR family response regulator
MKIVVLDPERDNLTQISKWINDMKKDDSVYSYESAFSFVTGIYDDLSGDVDLMLVHATEESVEMVKDIQNSFPNIPVIFFSRDIVMAERIYEANPLCFLFIPLSFDRLGKALAKAEGLIGNLRASTVTLSIRGRLLKLRLSSIKYLESDGRKLLIYSDEGYYETNMTMNQIQEMLPANFIRCHRSYIVNSERVKSLDINDIILTSKERIPLSRSNAARIKDILKSPIQSDG